jgi:hypothetical protein
VFTDYSLRQRTVTRAGSSLPTTVTAQSKFGAYGSSGKFPDNGWLVCPPIYFGSGPFSIGAWVRFDSLPSSDGSTQTIFGDWTLSTNKRSVIFAVQRDSSVNYLRLIVSTNGTGVAVTSEMAAPPNTNQWYFLSADYDGTSLRIGIDGAVSGAVAHSGTLFQSNENVQIGTFNSNSADYALKGHAQDLIVVKGASVFGSNFTPPARMTQRELTRTVSGADSVEVDKFALIDINGSGTGITKYTSPTNANGNFSATDLIDLEYAVCWLKDGCKPEIDGPYTVDEDV